MVYKKEPFEIQCDKVSIESWCVLFFYLCVFETILSSNHFDWRKCGDKTFEMENGREAFHSTAQRRNLKRKFTKLS